MHCHVVAWLRMTRASNRLAAADSELLPGGPNLDNLIDTLILGQVKAILLCDRRCDETDGEGSDGLGVGRQLGEGGHGAEGGREGAGAGARHDLDETPVRTVHR